MKNDTTKPLVVRQADGKAPTYEELTLAYHKEHTHREQLEKIVHARNIEIAGLKYDMLEIIKKYDNYLLEFEVNHDKFMKERGL